MSVAEFLLLVYINWLQYVLTLHSYSWGVKRACKQEIELNYVVLSKSEILNYFLSSVTVMLLELSCIPVHPVYTWSTGWSGLLLVISCAVWLFSHTAFLSHSWSTTVILQLADNCIILFTTRSCTLCVERIQFSVPPLVGHCYVITWQILTHSLTVVNSECTMEYSLLWHMNN